ncbi:MAG: hypothetical protein GY906_10090 [bacterium]|nr:hypothetical protein [bacterium]
MQRHKHPEYTRHQWVAEAKARGLAVDAYLVVEEMTGWALAAQLDPVVIDAAIEARSAMRMVRNLLLPDEEFPDDRAPIAPRRFPVPAERVAEVLDEFDIEEEPAVHIAVPADTDPYKDENPPIRRDPDGNYIRDES